MSDLFDSIPNDTNESTTGTAGQGGADSPINMMPSVDLNSSPESHNEAVPSDDLFFSTIAEPTSNQKTSEKDNNDDMDEIFKMNSPTMVTSTKEINLDDIDELEAFSTATPSEPAATPVISPPAAAAAPVPEIKPTLSSFQPSRAFESSVETNVHSSKIGDSQDEDSDEKDDSFIQITLSDAAKVGDGMGSYMVYKITTKTNMPAFKSTEFSANRRFSDFLNLYEKLKEKHLHNGIILPPAPEKDMIGMAKVKMSNKEESNPIEFIEKRRAALERFLTRIAKHKVLRFDPDFRDFLEISQDLPKATGTSALSGTGMLKMLKNVTDSVTKIAIKMDETDQWFEEKSHQIDNLYVQFKKTHSIIELLYGWRKDLALSNKDFSKATSILANSEEQLGLSRALSQLGEIYEKTEQIYTDQANADFFGFSELIKDYVCLLDNIKEVFQQRIKMYSVWQKNEELLRAKKDALAKLEAANKQDKIPTVAAEIKDLEGKVAKSKEEFENISKAIKVEMKKFDVNRVKEFKTELTKYLNTFLKNQEAVLSIWEGFLPQVKEI